MPRVTRPRLPEWSDFADALKELVKGAGMTNEALAQALGRGYDRGRAGAILEAREPCPEEVLVRLYKASAQGRHPRLRDHKHLHLLVRLWADAANREPGPVLRAEMNTVGTPWPEDGEPEGNVPGGPLEKDRATARSDRRTRIIVSCVAVVLLAAAVATGVVLRTRSTDTTYTGTRVSHTFPANYAGRVHLTVVPLPHYTGHHHDVDLQWGAWSRSVPLPELGANGATLVFTKVDTGTSVPLVIVVSPPARLAVGIGDGGGGTVIDTGWTRK